MVILAAGGEGESGVRVHKSSSPQVCKSAYYAILFNIMIKGCMGKSLIPVVF